MKIIKSVVISKRSEILFLYDIENANPNGDPLNENRPRFDTGDSTVLVSDVRLKRTIRDYWFEYKGFNGNNNKDIFIRDTSYKEGGKEYLRDGKRRAKDFNENVDEILDTCIDVRTFRGLIPLEKAVIKRIGPVQFQMGRSLNKTEIIEELGTGAFAASSGKTKLTFRTEYKVPYAVIGFNGIINEKSAQYSKMTNVDKELLIEGIWEGTKSLITRSKFGQVPLMLLVIDYKKPFYIGSLRQRIKLDSGEMNQMQIRNVNDYKIDVNELLNELKTNKEIIETIWFRADSRLKLVYKGKKISGINKDELYTAALDFVDIKKAKLTENIEKEYIDIITAINLSKIKDEQPVEFDFSAMYSANNMPIEMNREAEVCTLLIRKS